MLLHGFGDNASVWSHLAPRLMSQFHAVAFDLRGHGHSEWDPEGCYDAETFASDVTKVVAAFGFEWMTLIGHSWGAAAAIRFAAANPTMVAALVIVDFGPELAQAGVDEVMKGFIEMPRSFASTDEYACFGSPRAVPLPDSRLLSGSSHVTACSSLQVGIIKSDPMRRSAPDPSLDGSKPKMAAITSPIYGPR